MEKESYLMRTSRRFYSKSLNTFCRSNSMTIRYALLAFLMLVNLVRPAAASSRIKDVAHFTGVRNNSLAGYGLVIGLKGTGDKQQTIFTQASLKNMLGRYRLNIHNQGIRGQDISAVLVTADLPALGPPRSHKNVTRSA